LVVIEEDRNGKYFLYGWDYGLDFTEGGSESGTASTDLNGYNVTLSGEQKELEYEVSASIIAGLLT